MLSGWRGHPEKYIFDRVKKYSSKIFKTTLFGEPAAVVSGAAGNKFLFSNEDKLVIAWWPTSVKKIFPYLVQTETNEEAIKLRKLLPQFLKPEALIRYIGIMDTTTQRHFARSWENNKQVTVYPLAKKYAFLVACRLFLSLEDPDQVDRLGDPFNFIAAGIFSIPIDLPGTPFNRAIKEAAFVRKEIVAIIKQRKVDLAENKASPTQDVLSHMLLLSDENGEMMNEVDIANKLMAVLVGNHDSMSSAITSIVKYLAELPHIYDQVYQEQMEIANSKAPGELLNWSDIQKMKYSWNVVCEVLRLAPPIQGTFRESISDFIISGFSIPKGWKLYWSANSTHRNPEYFPEPEKFDPTRFQGTGPAPYTFVPFGGGPRMCPGNEYARFELLVFVFNIVTRYKWEKLIPDEKTRVYPTPRPAMGLPIRLHAHKA